MIAALGYLFIRSPVKAGVVYARLLYMLGRQAVADTYLATKIIWEQLGKPQLKKDAALVSATARASWGGLVAQGAAGASAGSQILFLGMGGVIVQNIIYADAYLREKLSIEGDPITGKGGVW